MNQISKVLKNHGVEKGDRVTLYMPMSPVAVASMLACARIGAMHSVVFTADSCHRGGRTIQCKKVVDAAIAQLEDKDLVKSVLVYKRTGDEVAWNQDLDKD